MQVNTNRIPNEHSNTGAPWRIWRLAEHPGMTDKAAVWFYEKYGWEYLGDVHESDGGAIRLYGTDTLS